jgi:L-iditol 2-dehydrogenase
VKAFVKTGRQPGEADVKDVPVTKPGPGEALLRVASCGVCGSDVHAFRSHAGFEWVRTPVTLGHEFSDPRSLSLDSLRILCIEGVI